MLYTVGHRDTYDKGVGQADFQKVGQRYLNGEWYPGGIVFTLYAEAAEALAERGLCGTYGVYGLAATMADVYAYKDGSLRLRNTVPIVKAEADA